VSQIPEQYLPAHKTCASATQNRKANPEQKLITTMNLFEAVGKSSLPGHVVLSAPDIRKTNDPIVIPSLTTE
jgi:hypothetical protein